MPYKDKEQQLQYQNAWTKARREAWIQENGPCSNCGSSENLEVDHIDRNTKVSHRIWTWKLERRLVELAKCHVLCYTCHKIKTGNEIAGENHPISTHTDQDVKKVLDLKESGSDTKTIIKITGFDRHFIYDVFYEKWWKKTIAKYYNGELA